MKFINVIVEVLGMVFGVKKEVKFVIFCVDILILDRFWWDLLDVFIICYINGVIV